MFHVGSPAARPVRLLFLTMSYFLNCLCVCVTALQHANKKPQAIESIATLNVGHKLKDKYFYGVI